MMQTAFIAPAQLITASVQLITAPAQLTTTLAHLSATGVALFIRQCTSISAIIRKYPFSNIIFLYFIFLYGYHGPNYVSCYDSI